MIIPRPLKRVLGKIIPFSQEDKIPTFNLGSGTADNTTYLRGDGTWATVSGGSGGLLKGTASGVDTYTTTITGVASYTDGDAYLIRFTTGNTTGCSLNINSLGAKTLYRNNDGVLIGGDIVDGAEMFCIYNSVLNGFQVIGTSPNTLISYVTNAESVTITKGQPVYAFGGQGDRLKVKLAYNTSDATSAQTVGLVVSSSIAANQKGFIIVSGLLDGLSILPTSTYADGDAIYLGATAGSITNVKPVAPNHMVYLGFVTTASNGSAGRMYVRVQNGYELQELHNVAIATPTNGQVLQYESATSLWKNATPSSGGITVGSTAVTSGTDTRIFFQNGGVVSQSENFTFNDTLRRLQIKAATGNGGNDVPFLIRNSADNLDIVRFRANGDHVLGSDGGASLTISAKSGFSFTALNLNGQGNTERAALRQTSNRLTFTHTNSNTVSATLTTTGLAIGFGDIAATAKLDIKAQGALSTDIAFRVRNSADTANLGQINGDGTFRFGDANGGLNSSVSLVTDGRLFLSKSGSNFIELNPSAANRLYSTNGWEFEAVGTGKYLTFAANGAVRMRMIDGTIQIGSFNTSDNATNTMYFLNGTAPNTNHTNIFKIYSADIVAGNAAPHFRTEVGDVIKLYKETTAITASTLVSNLGMPLTDTDTFDGYTLKQVVKALRNLGLLA